MDKPMDQETEQGDDAGDEIDSGPVDEGYIESASKAVSNLIPEDFKPMNGLKIPTSAADGEDVKMIITGKAKGGVLTEIYGAECDSDSEKAPKGRIEIMLMGGKNEEA